MSQRDCARAWPGVIEAYRAHLPVGSQTPAVTLLEGGTPLIETPALARRIAGNGGLRLWLKFEGLNPTGSFKDRGMTVAITRAVEEGARAVICASTGNTSASAAAYAARAGLRCIVLLPHGMTALGKLSQALVHGAAVVPVEGNFDDALSLVRVISASRPVTLVNSLNPDRIEGQKTVAFEVCDVLGDAPDFHAMPVGNAGNLTAAWRGYREYYSLGRVSRLPRLLGFQAAGAAPLATGLPFPRPETIATAIRIGRPASGAQALAARDESGGRIDAVTDDEIMAAYGLIARTEGLFCEPASAASVAGVARAWHEGYFDAVPPDRRRVVCTLTGHGLKDPEAALRDIPALQPIPAQIDRVLEAIELE